MPANCDLIGELELVVAPTALPVDRAAAIMQAKVEETDEYPLVDRQLDAAVRYVENQIDGQRQLVMATFDLPVRCFWEGELRLPRPPLMQVKSIKYYDTVGDLTTLDDDDYIVRKPTRQPGRVRRAPDAIWPSVQSDRDFPIIIRFVAGYLVPFTMSSSADTLTVLHGTDEGMTFASGDRVRLSSLHGPLGGLALRTDYFVRDVSGQTFKLAASSAGAAIDLTNDGAGFLGELPASIHQAVLMLISHWFENREGILQGTISKEIEFGLADLLASEGWGSYQ